MPFQQVLTMPLIEVLIALAVVALIAWITNAHVSMPQTAKGVLNVVLGLIVVGMLLWLVNMYVPMAGSIKGILNIVVVVACCIWVLKAFGLWGQIVRFWHSFTSHNLTDHRTPSERV